MSDKENNAKCDFKNILRCSKLEHMKIVTKIGSKMHLDNESAKNIAP
jgi:hypothetical protein